MKQIPKRRKVLHLLLEIAISVMNKVFYITIKQTKLVFLLVAILSILLLAFKLDQISDRIEWKEGVRIQWSDFQGGASNYSNENQLSATKTEITLRTKVDDSKIEHQVRCFFIKSKSWKKEGVSETLLQHEQLHFDIAELFARKLRKDLSRKTSINDNNEIYFKGIYKNVINECIAMQLQYDRETNHSRNRQFQVLWEGAIQEKLQQLSNYNKELVVSDTNLE